MDTNDLLQENLQENQQENGRTEKVETSCDSERPKSDFDSSNDFELEDDVDKLNLGESLARSAGNECIDPPGAVGGLSEEHILDRDIGSETSDVSGIDRLLQRHKNEIMFELRKLKFGDRPVTGGDERRHAVEALVGRCVGRSPSQVDRTPYEERTIHTESRRPEQVLVEVNALVERRPVSSVLQSLAFRRSLETSLRGAIGALQRNGSRGATVQSRVEQFQHSATAGATSAIASENAASVNNISPGSEASVTSSDAEMSRTATATQQISSSAHFRRPTPASGSPVPPADQPYVAGPARAQEWLQHHVPAVADLGDEPQMTNFELLQEMHRENLIMDISELIQSHLVTSALEGDFRHVLERRMRNHLDQTGVDGRRVQQHLQQLPRSHAHRRNDFYDLGIVAGTEGGAAGLVDHMDDVSVISATAAVAVPHAYTQSTAAMSREVRSLRTEVRELRGLMQLSFDLQLDIQRAVRQEVAAALAQSLGATDSARLSAPAATGPPRQTPTTGSDNQCLICLDRVVDTVLYQCGHMCLCYGCGLQLKQRGAHCPVCRAPIRDIIKAYQSL